MQKVESLFKRPEQVVVIKQQILLDVDGKLPDATDERLGRTRQMAALDRVRQFSDT